MSIVAVDRIRSLAGCLRFRRMMSSSSSSRMPSSNLGRNVISSEEKADNVSPWPWLMLRTKTGSAGAYRFYSLEEKKVLTFDKIANELSDRAITFIGSSHGWLASFNWKTCCVYLSDPVRRRQVYELPADNIPVSDDGRQLYPRLNIISCSSSDDQCRLLMTSHPHATLAFCAPARNSHWSFTDNDDDDDKLKKRKKYQSFVYSKTRKAFFCITEVTDEDGGVRSELESWDLRDPDSPKKIDCWGFHSLFDFEYSWPARSEEESKLKKLVCLHYRNLVMDEASDQLFLVVRHVIPHYCPDYSLQPKVYHSPQRSKYFHNTLDFDVFKIDLERKLVTHMADSLDGLAFFVGVAHYVVRPRTGTSRLKPNSIYFTDLPELCYVYKRCLGDYDGGVFADDGVFDYKSRAFSSLDQIIHSHPHPIDLQRQILVRNMLSQRVPLWYTPIGDKML